MTKKNRRAALLLSVAVVFVVLSSVLYIAHEANHDCIGEGCPICAQIEICEHILKALSGASAAASAAVLTYMMPAQAIRFADRVPGNTPVMLKVKLLN